VFFPLYPSCLNILGMYDFFGSIDFQDDQTLAFIMDGVTECQPVIDLMMSTEDMATLSMDTLSTKLNDETATACLQTLLGDNPFANYLRYTYQNLDQELDCFGRFGEALPHCVLTTEVSSESEDDAISMPLSLMKKLDCMISSSYESILDELCDVMYTSLDKCLAAYAATADLAVVSSCVKEEGLMLGKQEDLFGMDSSVLDGNNQIPGFCSRSFQRRGTDTTALQSRLDQYNKKREYGWVVQDTTAAQVVVKTAPKSLEDEADEVLETPQESYNSDPQAQDIALLQSSEWNNGEVSTDTETASGSSSFAIFVVVGVTIIAAVGLVLVVKRRTQGNDQQFKPVFGGDNTLPSVV